VALIAKLYEVEREARELEPPARLLLRANIPNREYAPGSTMAYSNYGAALGGAFQLRDDVLGVFGDPEATGKPAGDDLREGKRTVLLAHALAGTDASGRARVEALLGRPDLDAGQVDELRDVIQGSGAVARLEDEIGRLAGSARR